MRHRTLVSVLAAALACAVFAAPGYAERYEKLDRKLEDARLAFEELRIAPDRACSVPETLARQLPVRRRDSGRDQRRVRMGRASAAAW